MKEDLIIVPEIEELKNVIADARHDLSEIEEDSEVQDSRELAEKILDIIEEKIANKSSLKGIDVKEKVWFVSHLFLLENILEDIFDEDMFFLDDETSEEEDDEEEETEKK